MNGFRGDLTKEETVTSNIAFQEEVANSLGDQTEWDDHQAFVIAVYKVYGFNFTDVPGVIEVCQPRGDELESWREDRDYDELFGDKVATTAAGARALAAALIRAADAAEALEAA